MQVKVFSADAPQNTTLYNNVLLVLSAYYDDNTCLNAHLLPATVF